MTAAGDHRLQFVVVCEASADQQTACALADRVFLDQGVAAESEGLHAKRSWRGIEGHESFVSWIHVKRCFEAEGLRAHGHFEGRPGAPDAHAARRALLLVHRLVPTCHAVLLIRDSDNDLRRAEGLGQALAESKTPFAVVIGVAHTKRECWVIAAFDSQHARERKILTQLRRELKFDPSLESHRLASRDVRSKRNPKRALEVLCQNDPNAARVWLAAAPLALLRERGIQNGLSAFLDEVAGLLVPLF